MLDCILKPAGESENRFNFGVGIDVKHPLHVAYQRLAPMQACSVEHQPKNCSGWVFHFSHRNVQPIHWAIHPQQGQNGQTELWVKETEGREVELKISCPHSPKKAVAIELNGGQTCECQVTEDQVKLKLGRYALRKILIDW